MQKEQKFCEYYQNYSVVRANEMSKDSLHKLSTSVNGNKLKGKARKMVWKVCLFSKENLGVSSVLWDGLISGSWFMN